MNKKTIISLMAVSLAMPISAYAVPAIDNNQGGGYVRADLGYGISKHKTSLIVKDTSGNLIEDISSKKKGSGMLGSVGFGYYVTKEVRAELQAYIDDGLKTKSANGKTKNNVNYSLKSKEKTMAGFANLFYDFRNTTPFTPYVMGGLGYASNKYSVSNSVEGYSAKFKAKKSFVYQLGLGASYRIAKNLDLDLGYRAMQKSTKHSVRGKDKNGNSVEFKAKKDLTHAILAGIRVSF